MALLGHAAAQVPHPLHSTSLMTVTFFSSSKLMADQRAERIADSAAGALFRIHDACGRLDLDLASGYQRLDRGSRRSGLRDRVRNVLRTLARSGDEDAVGRGGDRRKLGMPFREESVAAADVESVGDIRGIRCRLQAGRQDDHVHRDAAHLADQRVFHPDDQFADFLFVEREIGDRCRAAADEADFFLEQAVVEFLVALSEAAHVDVEVVDIRPGLFLDQVSELQRIHAADAGAILVVALVPASDAVDDADALRRLAVCHQNLAAGRARSAVHLFEFEAGQDIRVNAVAVFRDSFRHRTA